jgi:hypothetical protein
MFGADLLTTGECTPNFASDLGCRSAKEDVSRYGAVIQYISQQNALRKIQQNASHKTKSMSGANSYMFRHCSAVLRELNNQKRS